MIRYLNWVSCFLSEKKERSLKVSLYKLGIVIQKCSNYSTILYQLVRPARGILMAKRPLSLAKAWW